MDSFHHHHHQQQQYDRRFLGKIIDGGGDHHWYPSSSPPPPRPVGYYNRLPPQQPPSYHHHHPHPQFQQHPHHHPMAMGPPPLPHPQAPSPYNGQPPSVPTALYPHHGQYLPRLHHPISMPHHPPPQPPSAYAPPPSQAWGNPSWAQHQGWEYPERNIPYNDEEDWAARAKAWASAKSGTENHHSQSHLTPVGRTDEYNYPYHDQYQQAVGPPRDVQQPSFPQISNQLSPVDTVDPLKHVNHLQGSTSFISRSSSYCTGYNAGDETSNANVDRRASPQKSYGSLEVSYSYSSASGNREAVHQSESLHCPLPLSVSSVQEGHHSQSMLPVQMISAEKPHFFNNEASTNFLPDACDRPLEFERRHDSDRESLQKINYGHAGPAGTVGMVDHDLGASSFHAWTPLTAAGTVGMVDHDLGASCFHACTPLTAPGSDPTFTPQASLPMEPSPVFGGIPAPTFHPNVPPVSAPYVLGPGASLPAATFFGDLNGALNLSERPKKAAVPNWLREEIIKKKPIIPSPVSTQPTRNSFKSVGLEDGDKSLRRAEEGDNKSIDSTRSTENEEEDEEDVEAARSAAINQEIKRVLTEVLLKVTDELFDEIATKVLNEDEQTVGAVEEHAINGNRKVSPPSAIPTPKASARVLVTLNMETNKVDRVSENSNTSSPGGNVLGLANYASDDGDEIQSSKSLSSRKKAIAYQHESNEKPSENDFRSVKVEADTGGVAQNHQARLREENYMIKNGSLFVDNLHYPDKASEGVSAVCEEPIPADSFPSESAISFQSKDIVGENDDKGKQSTNGHAKCDKEPTNDYWDRESRLSVTNKSSQNRGDNKFSVEKTSHESSDASDSIIHDRNKLKEKTNRRDKLKERVDGRNSEQGSNVKESDSRKSSKDNSSKDDRKERSKDKREKYKEDAERKRERVRDEKEEQLARATKDSSRYIRRPSSPRSRGKNINDNSFSHGSASGDEHSDNSKNRKQLSRNSSLLPSPTKSRKRQVSRSPPSKHSHRRHSPFSFTERRRRSKSPSSVHRRSSAHKHGP